MWGCSFTHLSTGAGITLHVSASSKLQLFHSVPLQRSLILWDHWFFANSLLIFVCFNLKLLILLQFIAHLCAVGPAEAMNVVPRKVGEVQRAGLNKEHICTQSRESLTQERVKRELSEQTWQIALILCTAWVGKPERSQSKILFGLPFLPLSPCALL